MKEKGKESEERKERKGDKAGKTERDDRCRAMQFYTNRLDGGPHRLTRTNKWEAERIQ